MKTSYFLLWYFNRESFRIFDNELKPITREGLYYIEDSYNFLPQIKDLNDIPGDALLVTAMFTADDAGLYPSIHHEAGIRRIR